MKTSHSAIRAPHYGIYRHLFELGIKIACIFTTTSLVVHAFNAYFSDLNALWQFHVSFSAMVLLEASLLVCWFALETQHEVPVLIKAVSGSILLGILMLVFTVSESYMGNGNHMLKAIFLGTIFFRTLLSSTLNSHTRYRDALAPTSSKVIFEMKRTAEKNQRLALINDMFERARLKEKQYEALEEVQLLKQNLIQRAYAKHHLAMAQLYARRSNATYLKRDIQLEQDSPLPLQR